MKEIKRVFFLTYFRIYFFILGECTNKCENKSSIWQMVGPKYKNALGLKPRDVLTLFERQLYKMQVSDQQ